MNWFKRLDKWTDRYTLEAIALIGLLIGTGIVLVLQFQDILGVKVAYFLLGVLAGNILFTIVDIIERTYED